MTSTDQFITKYNDLRPHFDRLKEEALYVIQENMARSAIKVHNIQSRVKELPSVLAKMEGIVQGGGEAVTLSNLDDIVGLRVVCLFLSDIPRIGDALRTCLKVVQEDNKIDGADVTTFAYQSVHFVCEIPEHYSGPRYDVIKNIRFEIQVRTIAMDAWAAASHYLEYKSEVGVPLNLRKDFFALSGLFYVADTHFEMFYKEAQKSREELRKATASKESILDRPINSDTLSEYLKDTFPSREHTADQNYSDLLEELLEAGYKSIGDLDRAINRAMNVFLKYENEIPLGNGAKKLADVGVVRVILTIADEKFVNVRIRRGANKGISIKAMEPLIKYRKFIE